MKSFHADILIFLCTFIGASMYIATEFMLTEMTVLNYLGLRFIILLPLSYPFVARRLYGVPWRFLVRSCIPGIFLGGAFTGWAFGITQTDELGVAAFVVSLEGIMVPILGLLLFRDRISLWVCLGLLLALLGLGFLTLQGLNVAVKSSDLIFLVTGFLFACYIVMNKHFNKNMNSYCAIWMQFFGCGLVTIPALLVFDNIEVSYSPSIWLGLAYVMLIATGLRFFIMLVAQKYTSVTHTGLILICEPVIVLLIDWVYVGVEISQSQLVGCGLIFLGCIVAKAPTLFNKTAAV